VLAGINESVTGNRYSFQMDTLEFLLSDPTVLTAALAVGIALIASGLSGSRRGKRWRSHRAKWTPRGTKIPPRPSQWVADSSRIRTANDPFHAAEQLKAVMRASFTAQRVLSATEQKVLLAAEKAVTDLCLPWRVMAQVALGEVLQSDDKEGFMAINAKRVDLLLIDERSRPVAAIEYQGQGHYQGTAPARDAIKKEALRKAGVGYIEITFDHGPDDVRREIARIASTRAAAVAGKQEFSKLVGNMPDQESAAHAV